MPPRRRSNNPANRRKRPTLEQRMECTEWKMSPMARGETPRTNDEVVRKSPL